MLTVPLDILLQYKGKAVRLQFIYLWKWIFMWARVKISNSIIDRDWNSLQHWFILLEWNFILM